MANTPSKMLALGTQAPPFKLPDPTGRLWTLEEVCGKNGILVLFICNHCPFVIHIAGELARIGRDFPAQGIGVVAINANDVEHYPADRPELMAVEAKARGYSFPYVYDATQTVARAYQAACTPDIFLFDAKFRLVYRGQLDQSRPGNGVPVNGADLRQAATALVHGEPISSLQTPSIGCNIKWHRGSAPI